MALLGIVSSRSSVLQARGNTGVLSDIVAEIGVRRVARGSIGTPVGLVSSQFLIRVAPPPAESTVKVWVAGAWVDKPVKVRLSGVWVAKPTKVWDGADWVLQT